MADTTLTLIARCSGDDAAVVYADLLDDLADAGRTTALLIWWRLV